MELIRLMGSYEKLKEDIQKLVGAQIESNTIIDQILYGVGASLDMIKEEINKRKNPHIYTGLKDGELDDLGLLVGCPRYESEGNESYFTRIMHHHTANQASNLTSINFAISNLKYSSHATYVPFTLGVGTSTIHFIPKNYEYIEEAKLEIEERILKVKAPDSFIMIEPATKIRVEIIAYVVLENDSLITRANIEEAIRAYINNIPIGETLSYAKLNMIGLSTKDVKYFNVVTVLLDGTTMHQIEKMQGVETKFVFDTIHFEVSST